MVTKYHFQLSNELAQEVHEVLLPYEPLEQIHCSARKSKFNMKFIFFLKKVWLNNNKINQIKVIKITSKFNFFAMTFKVEMQTIFAHSPLLMEFATVVCSAKGGWLGYGMWLQKRRGPDGS